MIMVQMEIGRARAGLQQAEDSLAAIQRVTDPKDQGKQDRIMIMQEALRKIRNELGRLV